MNDCKNNYAFNYNHYKQKSNERIKLPAAYQSQEFMIKNGFRKSGAFANTNYISTSEPTFKKYGAIHWISDIITDSDGNFKFSFPTMS